MCWCVVGAGWRGGSLRSQRCEGLRVGSGAGDDSPTLLAFPCPPARGSNAYGLDHCPYTHMAVVRFDCRRHFTGCCHMDQGCGDQQKWGCRNKESWCWHGVGVGGFAAIASCT